MSLTRNQARKVWNEIIKDEEIEYSMVYERDRRRQRESIRGAQGRTIQKMRISSGNTRRFIEGKRKKEKVPYELERKSKPYTFKLLLSTVLTAYRGGADKEEMLEWICGFYPNKRELVLKYMLLVEVRGY